MPGRNQSFEDATVKIRHLARSAFFILLFVISSLVLSCKGEVKRNSQTESAETGKASKSSYYQEEFRPQFHFSPEEKWMNDPNGLVYQEGIYHLFYQYYPDDIVWGPMHWGHATSKDLIHWERSDGTALALPITLQTGEVVDPVPPGGLGVLQIGAAEDLHQELGTGE